MKMSKIQKSSTGPSEDEMSDLTGAAIEKVEPKSAVVPQAPDLEIDFAVAVGDEPFDVGEGPKSLGLADAQGLVDQAMAGYASGLQEGVREGVGRFDSFRKSLLSKAAGSFTSKG